MKLLSSRAGLCLSALVSLLPAGAWAATGLWVPPGGTHDWNNSGNWTAAFPNATTETANANNDLTSDEVISLQQAITVNVLNLGDSTGPTFSNFFLAPGTAGALTLGGTNPALNSQNGNNTLYSGLPVILGGATTITTASGTLTINGTMTASGNQNLTFGGAGITVASGNVSLGSGTVNKNNAGTAAFNNSFVNTTGVFNVNAGVLTLGTGTSVPYMGNWQVNGAGATLNVYGSFNPNASIALHGTVNLYNTADTFNGIQWGGAGETINLLGTGGTTLSIFTPVVGYGNTNLTNMYFDGVFTGSGSIVKTNDETRQTLSRASPSFSGSVVVNGGLFQANTDATRLPGTGANVLINASGAAAPGYAIDQTFLGRINPASTGVVGLAAGSANALDFSAAGLTSARLGGAGGAAAITYTGILTPAGTTYRLGGGDGTLILTNPATLNNAGATTVDIGGNGTHVGGIVKYGASDLIPDARALVVNGGVLDLAGFNDTVGSVQITGGGEILASTGTSTLTSAGAIDARSGLVTANLAGAVALNKTTTGGVSLSGTNSYNGGTTVSAGTLRFMNAAAVPGTGQITVAAGAYAGAGFSATGSFFSAVNPSSAGVLGLDADSATAINLAGLPNVRLGSASAANLSGTLTPAGSVYSLGGGGGTLRISSNLTGTRSVDVGTSGALAAGTVILSGINSYSAGTTISGGATLSVSSDANLGAAGAAVTFSGTGGTLAFTPAIVGGYPVSNATATLTIPRPVAFTASGTSTLQTDVLGVGIRPVVTLSGTLTGGPASASTIGLRRTGGGQVTITGNAGGVTGAVQLVYAPAGGATLRLDGLGALGRVTDYYLDGGALLTLGGPFANNGYTTASYGLTDRVRNDANVHLRGGSITASTVEDIGTLYVDAGRSTLNQNMGVTTVVRAKGAMLTVGSDLQNVSTPTLLVPPTLNDNTLGGWAFNSVYEGGQWLAYDGASLRIYGTHAPGGLGLPYPSDLNAAVATDNVRPTIAVATPLVLSVSKTINSLIVDATGASAASPSVLNLNGKTLTVDNGGAASTSYVKITGGSLQPTGNELFTYGGSALTLDGVVVDNGTPVSLVVGSGTVTLSGTNGFTGGIYHNGGTLSWAADSALNGNSITVNGGSLNPAVNTRATILIGPGGATVTAGNYVGTDQFRSLVADSALYLPGGSIYGANPNLHGTVYVGRTGASVSAPGALGDARVLVGYTDRGCWLTVNHSGVTSSSQGITVYPSGRLNLNNDPTLDPITPATDPLIVIKANGAIGGTDTRLGALTYGAPNLVLEEGAIIVKSDSNLLSGISNLPNLAKWMRGGAIPNNLVVGTGTPWKGVSAANSNLALGAGTTVKAASDFYLNSVGDVNGTTMQFTGGNVTNNTGGAEQWVGYVTVDGQNIGNGLQLSSATASYSGVSKFVATTGAMIQATVATAQGTTATPIEVQGGGFVQPTVTNALNGPVTVQSGGVLQITSAMTSGLTGTGAVTFNPGGTVQVDVAGGLTGSQVLASGLPAGTVVRLNADNVTGINALTTGLIYELWNNSVNGVTRTQTGSANWTLSNGAQITSQTMGASTLANGTNALVIGTGGGTLSAATGRGLYIAENINAGANTLTIGSADVVSGMPRNGTVELQNTANAMTGTVKVTNGATLTLNSSAGGGVIGTANLSLEGGTLYLQNAPAATTYAATNFTLVNDSSIYEQPNTQMQFGSLTFAAAKTLTATAVNGLKFMGTTTLASGTNTISVTQPRFTALELGNGIAGTGDFTKIGAGGLLVSGNNVGFTGNTTVNAGGYLQWNLVGTAGSAFSGAFGTGTVTVDNGGAFMVRLNAAPVPTSITVTNPITVGPGGGAVQASAYTNSNLTGNETFTGNIALGGLLQVGSWTGDQNLNGSIAVYSGTITQDRTSWAPRGVLGMQAGHESVTISGNIVDSGSGSFTQPVVLRGGKISGTGNTYSTGTLVESQGAFNQFQQNTAGSPVDVQATSRLGTGSVEVMPGGRLKLNAAANLNAGATLKVRNGLVPGQVELAYATSVPTFTADSDGIVALAANNNLITSMATLGGGGMYLGLMNANLTSAALAPGTGNVYRFATVNSASGGQINAVLSGGTTSVLIGSPAWNVTGAGRIKLNATNSYGGGTTIINANAGAIAQATNANPVGTGGLTMKGGSFEYSGASTVAGAITFPTFTFSGGPAITTTLGSGASQKITFTTATRANAGQLTVAGSAALGGTQQIHIANLTNSNVGTTAMVAPYVVGAAGDFLRNDDLDGGTNTGLVPVTYTGTDINVANTGAVVNSAAATLSGNNTLYALKATGNIAGTSTLSVRSGGLIATSSTFSPNLTFADGATPVEGVIYNTGALTVSGILTAGAGLTKSGAGTLTLSNTANSIVGDITINGGTLATQDDRYLGNPTLSTVVLNGGTLTNINAASISYLNHSIRLGDLGGTLSWDSRSTANLRGQITGTGPLVVNGNAGNGGISTYNFDSPAPNTYSGGTYLRYGTVNVGLTSSLGTGDVVADNVLLYVYGDNGLANNKLTILSTSTVSLYGANAGVGALDGVGPLTLNDGVTVSVGAKNVDTTYYGNISPAAGATASLTKVGTGSLTLKGINSYTGPTTVSNGTLRLVSSVAGSAVVNGGTFQNDGVVSLNATVNGGTFRNSGSVLGNAVVGGGILQNNGTIGGSATVTAGTLKGTGTILGAVSVTGSGILMPGDSPGVMTIGSPEIPTNPTSGNPSAAGFGTGPGVGFGTAGDSAAGLTLGSGSTLSVEINGTTAGTDYDQVIVYGSVGLDNPTLAMTWGFTPAMGDLFFLVSNDGIDPVTGNFAGLPDGTRFTVTIGQDVVPFNIYYTGNATGRTVTGGNDIVLALAIIPEPAMLTLVVAGMVLMFPGARRNRTRG